MKKPKKYLKDIFSLSPCLLAMGFGFSVSVLSAPAVLAQTTPVSFEEQVSENYEDLILAVYAGKYKLSSGIFAVERNGQIYLPLLELGDLFGFFLSLDEEGNTITGSTYTAKDRMSFNVSNGTVSGSGVNTTLQADQYFVSPDGYDVYIEQNALAEVLSLLFEVNRTVLTLNVEAVGGLPFERNIERQRARERLEKRRQIKKVEEAPNLRDVPFVATPYQLIGKPTVDIQTAVGYEGRQDAMEYNLALRGVQDLGYASADYSIRFAEQGREFRKPENLRLRFTRENIYDGALPLNLQNVQWGDVNLKNRFFVGSSSIGRGLTFTTEKKGQSRQFDRIIVDGTALPGWEVELYVNDGLLDFGVVDDRGEYRFEDVELAYGTSKVKVVLYGPQGEIEEREDKYVIQSNKIAQGESIVSGGIVDANRDLIQIDKRIRRNRADGVGANVYGAYGITDRLTGFASASKVYDLDGVEQVRREYLTAGADATFFNSLAHVEVLKEMNGGNAVDARVVTQFLGFKVNAKTGLYNDFSSERAGDGTSKKKNEYEVTVRRPIKLPWGVMSTEHRIDRVMRENGNRQTNINMRYSSNTPIGRITDTITSTISNGEHVTTTGRLDHNYRLGKWIWRNSINSRLHPEWDVASVGTNLRYRKNKDYSYGGTLSRNFDSRSTRVSAQISRDFKKFLGSAEAEWASNEGFSLLMRASTSLGPLGVDGGYIMRSDSLSNVGPVAALTYLDNNRDGIYNDGDEPLDNAKVALGNRRSKLETDENGYVILPGAVTSDAKSIRISRKTIDDPYMVPPHDGYSIYPRPGVVQYVELPVVDTGAIDGMVTWQNDDRQVAGLVLQLMDGSGDIVSTSKTGVDGYFTFERIPVGRYSIRAAPESGIVIPFEYVQVTQDNLFQFGNDIQIVDLSRLPTDNKELGTERQAMLNIQNVRPLVDRIKNIINR